MNFDSLAMEHMRLDSTFDFRKEKSRRERGCRQINRVDSSTSEKDNVKFDRFRNKRGYV